MAGPYPPYPDGTASHPRYRESHPSQPFASQPLPVRPQHPQATPPPTKYPRRRRWRRWAAVLAVLAVVAGTTVAIVYAVRSDSGDSGMPGPFTTTAAKSAVQSYLDALAKGDTDTIARNLLCGMYDSVRDLRSDKALAKLASDAYRDQFSSAEVTSVDKIVYWSPNQAQVLFTMRVVPVLGGNQKTEEQATAQLLYQDNHILVCQYLLRSGGGY